MKNPWDWFKGLFASRGEDPRHQERFFSPYGVAGVHLTPDEALSLSAVWACVSIIATAIGGCQWRFVEKTGPNRRRIITDDPLHYVLNTRPNPDMTAIGFREAMLMVAIPFGNAYAEIVPDRGGRVAELWPLEPDRVTPRRNPDTWALEYEYRQPGDGTTVVLQQRSVFHLRGPGLHGLMGENIVARAAKSLGVAAAQERFTASFFGQGANPGGTLQMPAGVTLTPAQKLELAEDWAERKKGPENAHKPMFLENGWVWVPNTTDPQKSQLVEGRQFSVEEICRWFHVPPHKVQHLVHATFSNIEHQSIEFVRDACTPWCRALEQEADHKFVGPSRAGKPHRYTFIDTTPLTTGDLKSRADALQSLRNGGFITGNEGREELGLNDAGPDGDVLLVQGALTTVANILNPPASKALPAGKPAPDEDDEELDPDVDAMVAVTGFLAVAMARYARRVGNLRADAQKRRVPAAQVAATLAAARARLWPALLEEVAAVADPFAQRALGRGLNVEDLQRAAELVDAGAAPAAAAAKALPASCPQLPAGSLP